MSIEKKLREREEVSTIDENMLIGISEFNGVLKRVTVSELLNFSGIDTEEVEFSYNIVKTLTEDGSVLVPINRKIKKIIIEPQSTSNIKVGLSAGANDYMLLQSIAGGGSHVAAKEVECRTAKLVYFTGIISPTLITIITCKLDPDKRTYVIEEDTEIVIEENKLLERVIIEPEADSVIKIGLTAGNDEYMLEENISAFDKFPARKDVVCRTAQSLFIQGIVAYTKITIHTKNI